jgi:hypothetical protein
MSVRADTGDDDDDAYNMHAPRAELKLIVIGMSNNRGEVLMETMNGRNVLVAIDAGKTVASCFLTSI